jgi:hypothetical protein
MPYQTRWEKEGVFWKYTGVVTDEDIINSNNEFYGDPRSEESNYQLVDGLDIEQLIISPPSVELLAATDYAAGLSLKPQKVAFVAVKADVLELFQIYIDHAKEYNCRWVCKIFNDIESAREWISIQSLNI